MLARRWGNRSSLGRVLRCTGGIAVLALALSACAGPSTTSAEWHGPFTSAAFVGPVGLQSLVTWRGRLWASGYDDDGHAVWESSNGRTWVRHPSPGTGETQLVATPGSMVLLCSHAFGAGGGAGPPPYESVTTIYTSTNGVHWKKQSIPVPLEQGAVGIDTALWGHGRVVLPGYNLYKREPGVWTETSSKGPWVFHRAFGKGAGVLDLSLATTASGFVAGGSSPPTSSTIQAPAVWTSPNGVQWTKHMLSTSTGAVEAVGALGSRLVAVGRMGQSPDKGTVWISSGSRWGLAKVGKTFPPTVHQLIETGIGLVGIPDEEASSLYYSVEGTRWSLLRRPARFQHASTSIVAAVPWKGGIAAIIQPIRFHAGVRFWVASLTG